MFPVSPDGSIVGIYHENTTPGDGISWWVSLVQGHLWADVSLWGGYSLCRDNRLERWLSWHRMYQWTCESPTLRWSHLLRGVALGARAGLSGRSQATTLTGATRRCLWHGRRGLLMW